MMSTNDVGGLVEIRRAPVSGEQRVEHVAEPVQDHGPLEPVEQRRRRPRGSRRARAPSRPARDSPSGSPARPRPRRTRLLLVGGAHVGDAAAGCVSVRSQARRSQPTGRRLGRRAADQLLRRGPVEPHPALRRVHRLGDGAGRAPTGAAGTRASRPSRAARPVGRRRQRVGDDVRGGERHARARLGCARAGERPEARPACSASSVPSRARQPQCVGGRRASSSGTSTQRRSCHELLDRARTAARRARPRGSPTGTARRARRGAGTAPTAA